VLELSSRQDTLYLMGVTEEAGLLTCEALLCNRPLKRGRIFKDEEGNKYKLIRGISVGEYLLCIDISLESPVTILERV
jgi:hypothetical protein